jgi:hypothetical protein
MKIFLSWSGEKSRQTAEVLKKWLPQVIQALKPWISVDIEKGKRWSQEVIDNLEQSKVGIICLNKENLSEPWILFETGAIAKTKDSYSCIFLLDLGPADVPKPLGELQATKFEKDDFRKLMHTINGVLKNVGKESLEKDVLDSVFEKFWPELEEQLTNIENLTLGEEIPKRTERELLEEILEILRSMQQEKGPNPIGFLSGLLADFDKQAYEREVLRLLGGGKHHDIRREALLEDERDRARIKQQKNVARPKQEDSTDK